MMMYEGGYGVWGHTTNVTKMADAASGTPALRSTTNLVHMLWFESYPGHADFPSEYLFASDLGWAVFRPDLYGAATGGFNSPRFLGTIDTNRGVTPPPIEPPEVGEPVIVNPIKTFNSEQIIRSDFAGSTAMAITAPTAGTALTVTKEALSGIGSSGTLGTVTFAAGSRAGQFGHYNVELSHMHSGDRVTLNLPTPGDATLRGIAWSLVTDTVTPPIELPDQASPRTPVKVPQSVPSWCHGLNHPNLSACGSVHGRE
jgi:hypothetical protein